MGPSDQQSAGYLARADRLGMCDLMGRLGPVAPTLCEGWTTQDLAAHLVARDRRPDSVPGLVAAPLAGWSERVRQGELQRPFTELVERLRSGPPRWSPLAFEAADRAGNTHEMFVHYEDVRRAQPGWEPRVLDQQAQADLWRSLGWFAGRAFRRAPIGVELRTQAGLSRRIGHRPPVVALVGDPGELMLFTFGRRDHAQVELEGPPSAVEQLIGSDLSW